MSVALTSIVKQTLSFISDVFSIEYV